MKLSIEKNLPLSAYISCSVSGWRRSGPVPVSMAAKQLTLKPSGIKQPFIARENCGLGTRTVHSHDSSFLLHDAWDLSWRTWRPGARINWELIHSHTRWLMPAGGWRPQFLCTQSPQVGPPHSLVCGWWRDSTSECFKKEKEVGESLITFHDLASKSHSVIFITFNLLRQSQSLAPNSVGGETDSAYWWGMARECWTGNTAVAILENTTCQRS